MTTSALSDSRTMLTRSLRRMRRYPSLTLFIAGIPVVLLLLFVYVFGGTLGAGLGGGVSTTAIAASAAAGAGGITGRDAYVAYVLPGILLITVAGAAQGTAISVAMDMTAGIIARFRTMAIARSAVLVGHVLGAVLQTLLATVIVVAVALLMGFRPSTSPGSWVLALAVMVAASVAVSWLSVALGLAANSVETASNSPMILTLLPFLGSGFVPPASMPEPLRWFAEHQPFTPIMETLRGLLVGTPIGDALPIALAWCMVISIVGYAWSVRLFSRLPVRPGA